MELNYEEHHKPCERAWILLSKGHKIETLKDLKQRKYITIVQFCKNDSDDSVDWGEQDSR